jgi:hypothetical protein
MAKLPNIRRLRREDFPDQGNWVDKLILAVNGMLDSVLTLLDGNLSVKENMGWQLYSHVIDVPVGALEPSEMGFPILFKATTKTKRASAVLLASAEALQDEAFFVSGLAVDWSNNGDGQIKIRNIPGITTGKKYRLNFMVIP